LTMIATRPCGSLRSRALSAIDCVCGLGTALRPLAVEANDACQESVGHPILPTHYLSAFVSPEERAVHRPEVSCMWRTYAHAATSFSSGRKHGNVALAF
jgi:hypothetical protein